ncbi:MAG: HlyD family efflux transporter periplasmic adaptor subunit [Pseudomonadota bacterium]
MLLLPALVFVLSACGGSEPATETPKAAEAIKGEAGHGKAGPDGEAEKGPHGGRLLKDGGFTLELAIFETGVPPEFRAWATQDGNPLAPDSVKLGVALERLGGVTDRIEFVPHNDFLRSTAEIYEPHSFVVKIEVAGSGGAHRWSYDSFEGRTTIPVQTAKEAGVIIETAGPRTIRDVLPLYGVITPNPEKTSEIRARYPGTIRSVGKSQGDTVQKGAVLAQIESDESLRTYDLTAPISGVVTMRNANPGEQTGNEPLFTVTDLSQVVAELSVFPRDLSRLRPGQRARIRSVDGGEPTEGEVVRVSPVGASANQSLSVRVRLDNRERRWTPGINVNAEVLIGGDEVPVAIKADALQRFRDWQVAFENSGDLFEARPLELGRNDGEWVEVKSGLRPGARYVAANSFLIKADIEKSGASHDH